jgi:C-terminal processing protease CtpA/Prc
MENKEIKKLEFGDVKEIYKKILGIYPFLTTKEKSLFELKAKKIITNEELFNEDKEKLLKSLLGLLKNPHAIIKIRNKVINFKWPRYSPEYNIDNNILYIRIPTWSVPAYPEALKRGKELINICVKNGNNYKGIIFDVRGNGGGNSNGAEKLATIFFKNDFTTAYIYKIKKGKLIKSSKTLLHNQKYFIDVPVVILIDEKCFSSNELFILPFKIRRRATLIGKTTRGGSANPKKITYVDGRQEIIIRIPTWRLILKGEKKPLEETKIKPDIIYKKDDIVEYAKLFLNKIMR